MLTLACNMRMDLNLDVIIYFLLIFFAIPVVVAFAGVVAASFAITKTNSTILEATAAGHGPFAGKPLGIFTLSVTMLGALFLASSSFVAHSMLHSTWWDTILTWVIASISALVLSALIYLWRKEPDAKAPRLLAPNLVWLQDIVITVLCFGAGLATLWFVERLHHFNSEPFLQWAVYLFTVGASGLILSIDLCRTTALGQLAAPRAIIFILVFTLMPLMFPVLWMAWASWRKSRREK